MFSRNTYGRSTPTHVGNTAYSVSDAARSSVHPHARGEYLSHSVVASYHVGPPPRTWGIRYVVCAVGGLLRSTPTHVGNTCCPSSNSAGKAVHPHARGEYGNEFRKGTGNLGPPPRTWGIHNAAARVTQDARSTPTHVGNTGAKRRRRRAESVHPHARGEYFFRRSKTRGANGPPPRTWGIRPRSAVPAPAIRSTPTHVGNTRPSSRSCRPGPVHPHARGEYWPAV